MIELHTLDHIVMAKNSSAGYDNEWISSKKEWL